MLLHRNNNLNAFVYNFVSFSVNLFFIQICGIFMNMFVFALNTA